MKTSEFEEGRNILMGISLLLISISVPIASLSDVVAPIYYKKFFDELVGGGDVAKLTGFLISVLITPLIIIF